MKMSGSTAIVTGGGTGIGRATSLKLASCGADIAVNYRLSRDDAEDTARECRELGVRAVALAADVGDDAIGESLELLTALRLLSRRTVARLSADEPVGSTTSLDKLAMSTAEKFLFDVALAGKSADTVFGHPDENWRNDYLYSRASSIYGGAAEIQRNIIAERLLGLPR